MQTDYQTPPDAPFLTPVIPEQPPASGTPPPIPVSHPATPPLPPRRQPLNVTTVTIIVLVIIILILGIVLVRTIYPGSTAQAPEPTAVPSVVPTLLPTRGRSLSTLATESAFLDLVSEIQSVSSTVTNAELMDSRIAPPIIELKLDFSK